MQRNKSLRSKREKRRESWPSEGFAFPKPPGREYDEGYLREVRKLACLLRDVPDHRCSSRRSQADHAGKRPLGRKSHDKEAIPLCAQAHAERQTYTGWCAGLDDRGMRLVLVTAIAETRARVEQRRAA